VIVATVVGLGIGFVASNLSLQPGIIRLEASEQVLESRVSSLNAQIEELKVKESELVLARSDIADLNNNVGNLVIERDTLTGRLSEAGDSLDILQEELTAKELELDSTLGSLDLSESEKQRMEDRIEAIGNAITRFESDRLLLVELRKEVPATREEAIEFWSNVREIARSSDPSLGIAVDKVISTLGPYYNWLETQPEPDADMDGVLDEGYVQWAFFPPLGTFDYFDEIGKFQNDALLVIIVRMDAALSLIA